MTGDLLQKLHIGTWSNDLILSKRILQHGQSFRPIPPMNDQFGNLTQADQRDCP
jgi:hypothetical protein